MVYLFEFLVVEWADLGSIPAFSKCLTLLGYKVEVNKMRSCQSKFIRFKKVDIKRDLAVLPWGEKGPSSKVKIAQKDQVLQRKPLSWQFITFYLTHITVKSLLNQACQDDLLKVAISFSLLLSTVATTTLRATWDIFIGLSLWKTLTVRVCSKTLLLREVI